MSTKTDLEKLRKKLPRGYAKTIAARTGKSESAVYQTVTGKINSVEILDEALILAQSHSKQNNHRANQLSKL